jgi:hypothetical protein
MRRDVIDDSVNRTSLPTPKRRGETDETNHSPNARRRFLRAWAVPSDRRRSLGPELGGSVGTDETTRSPKCRSWPVPSERRRSLGPELGEQTRRPALQNAGAGRFRGIGDDRWGRNWANRRDDPLPRMPVLAGSVGIASRLGLRGAGPDAKNRSRWSWVVRPVEAVGARVGLGQTRRTGARRRLRAGSGGIRVAPRGPVAPVRTRRTPSRLELGGSSG